MKVDTRNFGTIDIEEDKIITFNEGLPGFEELHKFALIESKEGIFNYLQSLERCEICFIITDPYRFYEDYAPIIGESYFEKLGGGSDDEFVIYSVVCIKDSLKNSTINLAGPLLIHINNKMAVQVITEDKKYNTRHQLICQVDGGE